MIFERNLSLGNETRCIDNAFGEDRIKLSSFDKEIDNHQIPDPFPKIKIPMGPYLFIKSTDPYPINSKKEQQTTLRSPRYLKFMYQKSPTDL
jgi:hypothetical protein